VSTVDVYEELLEAAGLRFVSDAEAGIRRVRAGRGFHYRHDRGDRVTDDRTLGRIRALVIPPAWTKVWICRTATGHVQATGRDGRGRKQYRYHDEWRRLRDESKFGDLVRFGDALPTVRRQVAADLALPGLPEEKVVALVVALLDRTLIRVGNDAYRRENGTYGLTTLLRQHVVVDGAQLRFRFTGKGGLRHQVRLSDRRLAAAVRRCHELGGREVFSYLDDAGELRRVDSADCNDYLRRVAGAETTVKTFRTWGGTVTAFEHLVHLTAAPTAKDHLDAIDAAALRLGNTRAVARRSYVHPVVLDAEVDLVAAWAASRRTDTMSRAERGLLRLLA